MMPTLASYICMVLIVMSSCALTATYAGTHAHFQVTLSFVIYLFFLLLLRLVKLTIDIYLCRLVDDTTEEICSPMRPKCVDDMCEEICTRKHQDKWISMTCKNSIFPPQCCCTIKIETPTNLSHHHYQSGLLSTTCLWLKTVAIIPCM